MAKEPKEHVKKHLEKRGIDPRTLTDAVIDALNAFSEDELDKVDKLGAALMADDELNDRPEDLRGPLTDTAERPSAGEARPCSSCRSRGAYTALVEHPRLAGALARVPDPPAPDHPRDRAADRGGALACA